MANNVDLMVVGATEGLSAVELTERLVAEFKQPAEAFTELVAAACGGGPKYAAQSSVTLDTAVEGQGKLEDLGVVCELLVDGEVLSSSGFSNPVSSAAAGPSDTDAAEVDVSADTSAGSAIEAEAPESVNELDEISFEESSVDLSAEDASSSKEKSEDTAASAESGLESAGVDFEDELGALGSIDTPDNQSSVEEAGKTADADGLEAVEIDFNDELTSLDDFQRTDEKSEPEATEIAKDDAEPAAQEQSVDEPADTESIVVATEADDVTEAEQSVAAESKADADKSIEAPLELSLAVDDSTPLTKPKKKSDATPDDGGLTLVLDDEPAGKSASAPKKAAPVEQPAAEVTEEKADPNVDSSADSSADLSADLEPDTDSELRDTSREPVEITPPVEAPEEEAEPEAAPESETRKDVVPGDTEEAGQHEPNVVDVAQAEDAADSTREGEPETTEITAEAAPADEAGKAPPDDAGLEPESTPEPEPEPEKADDITSFIASLAGDGDSSSTKSNQSVAGGLVMPGQAEAVAAPSDSSQPSVEDELQAAVETSQTKEEGVSDQDVANLTMPDALAPEILEADEDNSAGKKKLLAMAVAGLGVVGIGAVVAMQTGLLGKTVEPATTVVAVAPVKDKSAEFDAVEEGSLNAAIERAEVLKNPDKYTTEELIVYLAEDLGENAKNELKNYVSGGADYKPSSEAAVPRMGAAIPADSDSELWLRNRVNHPADEFFDEWSKREVDLQAYLELQERLIEVGDLEIALDVSKNTKDKLFAVMSQQRLARAYHDLGKSGKASELLARAVRGTYAIKLESERVLAIADYALTEQALGLKEDAEDSFLKASILSRSLHKPQNRTVAFSAIAEFFHKAQRKDDMRTFLDLAMTTAYELPVNTAARDLAIRHVALTEVRLGLTDQATEHANLIVDPFAAVSALHGIALELERTGDEENARQTLNMAYRAGSLIKNSDKREKLLEKIRLAGS